MQRRTWVAALVIVLVCGGLGLVVALESVPWDPKDCVSFGRSCDGPHQYFVGWLLPRSTAIAFSTFPGALVGVLGLLPVRAWGSAKRAGVAHSWRRV